MTRLRLTTHQKTECLQSCVAVLYRGFPVQQYGDDRVGLVIAFWAVGLHLGRPLISQTDYKADGSVFGSVLNHVTDGRWLKGNALLLIIRLGRHYCAAQYCIPLFEMLCC